MLLFIPTTCSLPALYLRTNIATIEHGVLTSFVDKASVTYSKSSKNPKVEQVSLFWPRALAAGPCFLAKFHFVSFPPPIKLH